MCVCVGSEVKGGEMVGNQAKGILLGSGKDAMRLLG